MKGVKGEMKKKGKRMVFKKEMAKLKKEMRRI